MVLAYPDPVCRTGEAVHSSLEAPCPRILVIEDDAETARGAAEALSAAGWRVEVAADGAAGLEAARTGGFDVLIVDRMLPRLDGLTLVETLRRERSRTPILFVTAMGTIDDRVAGLEGGGDDYLVKPYSLVELKARVHALMRRAGQAPAARTLLQAGQIELDRLTRSARRGPRAIDLLPLEFKLLELLVLNAGRIVTRKMLLEEVWGFQFDPRTNIVETHISRLRRKLDAAGEASLISTIRGAGYVLAAE